jgi:hypothetical protein
MLPLRISGCRRNEAARGHGNPLTVLPLRKGVTRELFQFPKIGALQSAQRSNLVLMIQNIDSKFVDGWV